MKQRKTMPDWMIERKQQIYDRMCFALLMLILLMTAFACGYVFSFEEIHAREHLAISDTPTGLYAGFTNENWMSYELSIEQDKKEPVTSEIEQTYTNDDYELLAKLIYRETGNQGWDCMVACGSVVLNRINNEHYPDTLNGVIFQKGQYTVTFNRKRFNNTVPSEEAYWCAEFLLQNGSQIPANVIYQGKSKTIGSGVWRVINGEVYCYE